MTGWSLNYAPHLGFPGPENPWFLASEGPDPVRQIERVAREGFHWVCDNGLMLRPATERSRIASALKANGVRFSSFVDDPALSPPRWNAGGGAFLQTRDRLVRALEAGHAIGAHFLTVVSLDEGTAAEDQMAQLAENLGRAAPMAQAAGITLVLEPVNPHRLAGAFVTEVNRAACVLDRAAAPGVRMSFDIEHIRHGDGDLIAAWDRVRHHVGLVQVADSHRGEPGSGQAPITAYLRHIRADGYGGTIELEHRHSMPGVAGETQSLARLRAIDAAITS